MPTPVVDKALQQRQEAAELSDKQTALARELRIRRAARKDPAVEELYAETLATGGALSLLRTQHAELLARADLVQGDNVALREQLGAADAGRSEALRAAEDLANENARLLAENAELKEKLTVALKPKKA